MYYCSALLTAANANSVRSSFLSKSFQSKYENYLERVEEFNSMMNIESILPRIYELRQKLNSIESF